MVITALVDAEGRHRGYAKVTRDQTARREHEELLRRSEERFRLMVAQDGEHAELRVSDTGCRIAPQ